MDLPWIIMVLHYGQPVPRPTTPLLTKHHTPPPPPLQGVPPPQGYSSKLLVECVAWLEIQTLTLFQT